MLSSERHDVRCLRLQGSALKNKTNKSVIVLLAMPLAAARQDRASAR
jgi:hypothetical protein